MVMANKACANEELEKQRRQWGVFRDRRPSHYSPMLKLDIAH